MNQSRRATPRLVHRLTTGGHVLQVHDDVPSQLFRPNPAAAVPTKNRKIVEVWTTPCIVTNFGKNTIAAPPLGSLDDDNNHGPDSRSSWTVLINPGNSGLTGCRNFAYFPRGGPVPSSTSRSSSSSSDHSNNNNSYNSSSTWGGMEIGSGLLFPAATVDGLVHQRGGWELRAAIHRATTTTTTTNQQQQQQDSAERCPVGHAVPTLAAGDLAENYHAIVHTTPPFFRQHTDEDRCGWDEPDELDPYSDQAQLLEQCYASALQQVDNTDNNNNRSRSGIIHDSILVATPLLGAGCRGFPVAVACAVAARAAVAWWSNISSRCCCSADGTTTTTLAFGVLEETTAALLVRELHHQAKTHTAFAISERAHEA